MTKKLDPTVERVAETASADNLFGAGDRVVAAVSGGADSLALLHILWILSQETGFGLRVASLDHGLRGRAGGDDQAFVAGWAEKLGLVFHGAKVDAGALAQASGLSLEDAARRVRHKFLGGTACGWGASPSGPPQVALGHTADDQAETVLMRLVEGTGLEGLSGMPIKRQESGWIIVRPLLRLSRTEVRDYCLRWNLEPRVDETNDDLRFRRNLVRIRLMPALAEYNPRVSEALVRLADAAGPELVALEEEVTRRTTAMVSREVPPGECPFAGLETVDKVTTLCRTGLASLERWVKRRLFRRILWELTTPEGWREIGLAGVDRAVEATKKLKVGGRLHLPGGLVFEAGYKYVFFAVTGRESGEVTGKETGRSSGAERVLSEPVQLIVPGRTEVEALGWVYTAEWRPVGSPAIGRGVLDIDPNRVMLPLKVRTRRRGESLQPAGMAGTKSLKDFFIAHKVPRAQRDRWPLVVDAEDRIVWVTALRGDARFVADRDLDRTIRLRAERG